MAGKSPLTSDIGRRITDRRHQLGLTQEQAAERTGLSSQYFGCIESGIKAPRAQTLIKLSSGLGMSADYILTGQATDIDRMQLVDLLKPLDAKRLFYLEEIIKQYVLAFTDDSNS